jgi:hypothetical protein
VLRKLPNLLKIPFKMSKRVSKVPTPLGGGFHSTPLFIVFYGM